MMRTLILAAMAVLLAPAAVRSFNPFPNVDLCELYSAAECPLHGDKCVPCHAWDKVDFCVEAAVAKHLPTKVFSCDFPPAPDTDCQSLKDEQACSAAPTCVWCLSAAVPSACYTSEEAKRLPAAVFKCKFPSLAAQ